MGGCNAEGFEQDGDFQQGFIQKENMYKTQSVQPSTWVLYWKIFRYLWVSFNHGDCSEKTIFHHLGGKASD